MCVAVLAPGGCGGVCEGGGPSRESVEDNDALDMRDSVLAVRLISSGGQASCEPIMCSELGEAFVHGGAPPPPLPCFWAK